MSECLSGRKKKITEACGHLCIKIFQTSIFDCDPADLSLKCERSKAPKPSIVWNFQKISRSNLRLSDPWQAEISLYLSLPALHLLEYLSDLHLQMTTWVFIMCMNLKSSLQYKGDVLNIIFNFRSQLPAPLLLLIIYSSFLSVACWYFVDSPF